MIIDFEPARSVICIVIPLLFKVATNEAMVDSKSTPQNIQDAYLNTARRERISVTIYLVDGTKLIGRIRSFDKFSLLLDTGSQEQLLFKHAISSIAHDRRATGEVRNSDAGDPVSVGTSRPGQSEE